MKFNQPRIWAFSGVIAILSGLLLLLWTNNVLPASGVLVPVWIFVAGLSTFIYFYLFERKWRYVFLGLFACQAGVILLLLNTIAPKDYLIRFWPLGMTISGISLVPLCFKENSSSKRLALLISSVALILLSLLFLVFSMKLVKISFLEFVLSWWPLLLIIQGAVFLLIHVLRRQKKTNQKED